MGRKSEITLGQYLSDIDVVIGGETHCDILQVLSSETAQEIVTTLKREPGTASDVATAIGQSIQNVTYHLDRLRDVDLVTLVGTWYSEKGKEMTVYALTTEELVVQFADSTHQDPAGSSDHR